MNISKIDKQVLKMMNIAKTVRRLEVTRKERKSMSVACFKFSDITGASISDFRDLTDNATMDQFTFLKTLVNQFKYKKMHSIQDNPDYIFDVYSKVDIPTATHLNIVRKFTDSFRDLGKIFSLAKDKNTLQFIENLEYGELKNSNKPSKLIIDILSSKNADRYIENIDRYSSYFQLNADNEEAIKNLDKMIETGKFSRFQFDAKLAIKKLFKNRRIDVAMAGKTDDLEKMYTKDRASFLNKLVTNFMPARVAQKEETKSAVVNMYGSLNPENVKLRNAIVSRFKNVRVSDSAAEVIEMQKLFNKIDNDAEARKFVQKSISKDLKIASIAELNEVLQTVHLKKANIFFNNAKRIIERSEGAERKNALIYEMENPFFESKTPKNGNTRLVRIFADKYQKDDFCTKIYKIVENKFNQYRYSRLSA